MSDAPPPSLPAGSSPALSPGELLCLRHVAAGLQTKEIAVATGLSPHTVDTYLKAAMRKLGAPTRREAARRALVAMPEPGPPPSQRLGPPPSGLSEPADPVPPTALSTGAPPPPAAEVREMRAGYLVGPAEGPPAWVPRVLRPLHRTEGGHNRLPERHRLLLIFWGGLATTVAFSLLVAALLAFGWANRTLYGR